MSVQNGVSRLREGHHWSQEELARRSGISVLLIKRIENGAFTPGWDMAKALAATLGVTIDELARDTPYHFL
ncbi:MAG: helix-turn-helix transcriptional regulator [Nitrospinae bacterium]|nr:helix-turn-helix transcriptional regulator [Nitrospinota bacterium]